MDKKGRPRPGGYRMEIDSKQAAVVMRIFVVRRRPATHVDRQDAERVEKPESEWIVHEDEALRIVPKQLWRPSANRAQGDAPHVAWRRQRKARILQTPGQPASALPDSPTRRQHGLRLLRRNDRPGQRQEWRLLRLPLATKGACENKTLVRRTLAEKVILQAVREQISEPEHIAYVLTRVEQEIAKLRSDLLDTLKLKEAELTGGAAPARQFRRLHRRGPRQPGTREGARRDRTASRHPGRRGRCSPAQPREDLPAAAGSSGSKTE